MLELLLPPPLGAPQSSSCFPLFLEHLSQAPASLPSKQFEVPWVQVQVMRKHWLACAVAGLLRLLKPIDTDTGPLQQLTK